MKQLSVNLYYHLIGEFILTYLLFLPIFILNHVENEGIYFIIAFISSMIVMKILSLQSAINNQFLIGIFLLGVIVGFIFKLSIVPLILLLAYCLIRVRAVLLNGTNDSSKQLLFYTFTVAVVVLFFNLILGLDQVKDVTLLVSLLVSIQLFYCLVIGYIKNLLINNKKWTDVKFFLPLLQMVTTFIIAIGGLYLLRDFLLRLFFNVIQGFIYILQLVLTPILKLLDIDVPPLEEMTYTPIVAPEVSDADVIQQSDTSFITFVLILFGLVIFIVLLVILYKLMNRKNTSFSFQTEIPIFEQTTKDLIGGFPRFYNNSKEPTNKIRKEIYQLEKFAYKKGIARQQEETVRQWFDRLNIAMPPLFFDYYEQVRYGEQIVDSSIQETFTNYSKIAKQLMLKKIKEMKMNQ